MNLDNKNISPHLSDEENRILNSENLTKSYSYDDKFKELYGVNSANNAKIQHMPNQYVQQTIVNNGYCPNVNYNNTVSNSYIAPNQNAIVDNVANLKYLKMGYNNVSLESSQYGLSDLYAKDWFKYNMILLVPIFNTLFFFYYSCLKTFIRYPVLKEWSKSAIITSVCINILYILVIFLFI